ncbi:LuxR family transcriptional regulator [Nonomuraea wenchangensis]
MFVERTVFVGPTTFVGRTSFVGCTSFVGRTAELALLHAELRAAAAGHARTVVIDGPEGIGKTALVRRLVDGEAAELGCRVLAVAGEEGERGLGLGLLRELAVETGRLLAPVHRPPSDLPGPERVTAAAQAVCDALAAAAAVGPVVLVVDDAQWADTASLHALGYVLRRLRGLPVLAIVACRDLGGAWLPDGLRRLLTADDTVHVPLGGLSATSLADLSATMPWATDRRAGSVAGSCGASPRVSVPPLDGPCSVWSRRADRLSGPGVGPSGALSPVSDGLLESRASARGAVSEGPGRASGAGALLAGAGSAPAGRAGGLSAEAAERLRDHTLGNPLHARALLATVPVHVLEDLAVRLPAPETYARPFARRLGSCAPATGRLVIACAVLGDNCPLHVAAAVAGGLDDPLNALEEAVTLGLLRELPGRLAAFPDPLARAAVYDGLGAGARARLHLAAASATGDAGTSLRHRAAAADGPDDGLADELTGYAAKAAQHGRWREAADHLDLAAGLIDPALAPARRDGLRTAALEHVLIGGDVLRATRLAAALGGPDAEPDPARSYVLGRLALAAGRFDEAGSLLTEAWRRREPGFAADVAEQLAWLHLLTGDPGAAVRWARLALAQPIQGTVAHPYDVLALARATATVRVDVGGAHAGDVAGQGGPGDDATVSGRPASTAGVHGSGPRAGEGGDGMGGTGVRGAGAGGDGTGCTAVRHAGGTAVCGAARDGGSLGGVVVCGAAADNDGMGSAAGCGVAGYGGGLGGAGVCHAVVDDGGCGGGRGGGDAGSGGLGEALAWLGRDEPERACAVLRRVVAQDGKAGLTHHRLLAAGLLAAAEHRAARWDDAAARAEGALAEAAALGQRWLLPLLPAACAAPLAAQGRDEEAVAYARAAMSEARRLRHAFGEAQAGLALALLGAEDAPPPGDVAGPFVPDPRPRRVEVLIAAGRLSEAERLLADLCEAGTGEGLGARRRAERGRLGGLLLAAGNEPGLAERSFERALALVEHGVCPLEEARVLLDLGRLLRRTGRRRAAAGRLAAARAAFVRLGARSPAERCLQELKACGLETHAPARLGLTPQELSTATLVAHGLTNRQIAAELLISVKTVEYHLGKIYAKLGIGSRVALAAKVTASGGGKAV